MLRFCRTCSFIRIAGEEKGVETSEQYHAPLSGEHILGNATKQDEHREAELDRIAPLPSGNEKRAEIHDVKHKSNKPEREPPMEELIVCAITAIEQGGLFEALVAGIQRRLNIGLADPQKPMVRNELK